VYHKREQTTQHFVRLNVLANNYIDNSSYAKIQFQIEKSCLGNFFIFFKGIFESVLLLTTPEVDPSA